MAVVELLGLKRRGGEGAIEEEEINRLKNISFGLTVVACGAVKSKVRVKCMLYVKMLVFFLFHACK